MSSVKRTPVLIVGNPNVGKTTLFNRLAGVRARVGNFPGVTVERRSAPGQLAGGEAVEWVDLPGTYSLTARSPEEAVAVQSLSDRAEGSKALVVLDSTAMARGLYLALQVREMGIPVVMALNLSDDAEAQGLTIDVEKLSELLGAPCVSVSASSGDGMESLLAALEQLKPAEPKDATRRPLVEYPDSLERDLRAVEESLQSDANASDGSRASLRSRAAWALLSLGEDEIPDIAITVRETVAERRRLAAESNRNIDQELVAARYASVDALCEAALISDSPSRHRFSDRLDSWLVHPVSGTLTFACVMFVVFQALFAWSDPMIGVVEGGIASAQDLLMGWLAPGMIQSLLVDGVVAGVGNVLVFVPQIALLFVLITLLEDFGYLARVAFLIDRLMNWAGLNGRSFVPLLSGFACAIPAIMATRTIESRKDRLAVMVAIPFMSCSARLPIYVLVTATVFADAAPVLGVLSVGALVLFGMYTLSLVAALASATLLKRTVLKGPRTGLVLELPPYRVPQLRNTLLSTWERTWEFIKGAGTVILAFTIILWALLSYPQNQSTTDLYAQARETATAQLSEPALAERLGELDEEEAGQRLRESYGGQLGQAIEPVIEPLGYDWRLGIGVIGAFAAREVFVSTLGVVFSIQDADEENQRLRDRLVSAERDDGTQLLTPLVGISLMIFFVLSCQCMSTLAVVKRESQSWRWPIFIFVYMTSVAYAASLLVYQVGTAFGWGGG